MCWEQNVKEQADYACICLGWKQINKINLRKNYSCMRSTPSPWAGSSHGEKEREFLSHFFPQRTWSHAILHPKHIIVHNFSAIKMYWVIYWVPQWKWPPLSSHPIPQPQANCCEGFAVLVKPNNQRLKIIKQCIVSDDYWHYNTLPPVVGLKQQPVTHNITVSIISKITV